MEQLKRIGLLASLNVPEVSDSLLRLSKYLVANGYTVIVEQTTQCIMGSKVAHEVCSREELGEKADVAIVVGGDGSMLSAARDLIHLNIPLLGVNRGRLGFLTDIVPGEIEERLGAVLSGDYIISERFLLEMSVTRDNQSIGGGTALNDVVFHPGKSVRMMEFELYIDGQFVYSQRSDGLIIATPTGSTAYALSGGGPIMHPNLDAMVLVPMNPHTLSSRPIVVGGGSRISILVGKLNKLHPHVTCDGHNHISTRPGDLIEIFKLKQPIRLIHPQDHNFYATCRSKLGWGSRLDTDRSNS